MRELVEGATAEFCYVTTDLTRAIGRWVDVFGAGPFFKLDMPVEFGERNYRGEPATDSAIAALGFSGDSLIEFIQPTNEAPSVYREVLAEKGDLALHHIMPNIRPLSTKEYDALEAKFLSLGYAPALDMKLPGFGRNVLFDARPQLGSFVELLEITPLLYQVVQDIWSTHIAWDGERPNRDLMELIPK